MRKTWMTLALSVALVGIAATPLEAQSSRGETSLVGIKLFDTGVRLLQVYGNPDQMLPVGAGVPGATAPQGNRGPAGGNSGGVGGGSAPGAGSGGGGAAAGSEAWNLPPGTFGFGDQVLNWQGGPRRGNPGGGGATPPAGGNGGGGGGGGGFSGGGGSGGGGGVPAPASGLPLIRWVYKRNGCYYGFILDQNNRVVQIEAIGIQNRKVRTRRGVEFGDTFKEVMSKYSVPEGYMVNGDTIVMRYLTRDKVAFRLNRLGVDKPHVVTAIVVAAGKV